MLDLNLVERHSFHWYWMAFSTPPNGFNLFSLRDLWRPWINISSVIRIRHGQSSYFLSGVWSILDSVQIEISSVFYGTAIGIDNLLRPPSSLPSAKMETETTASKHNNSWSWFKVLFVVSQFIVNLFYMAAAFLVAPFYINTLPSRHLVTAIWMLYQPLCHTIWIFFSPRCIPLLCRTFVAHTILLCSWVWTIALVKEPLGLNGPGTLIVGVSGYVGIIDPMFQIVLIMSEVNRCLTEWSIFQVVHSNLSARFTGQASLPGSMMEKDTLQLEDGLLDVEGSKIPSPYLY